MVFLCSKSVRSIFSILLWFIKLRYTRKKFKFSLQNHFHVSILGNISDLGIKLNLDGHIRVSRVFRHFKIRCSGLRIDIKPDKKFYWILNTYRNLVIFRLHFFLLIICIGASDISNACFRPIFFSSSFGSKPNRTKTHKKFSNKLENFFYFI